MVSMEQIISRSNALDALRVWGSVQRAIVQNFQHRTKLSLGKECVAIHLTVEKIVGRRHESTGCPARINATQRDAGSS
jgi:hypothetical protein